MIRTLRHLKSQGLKVGQTLQPEADLAPSLQEAHGRQLLTTGNDVTGVTRASSTNVKYSSKITATTQNQCFQYAIN